MCGDAAADLIHAQTTASSATTLVSLESETAAHAMARSRRKEQQIDQQNALEKGRRGRRLAGTSWPPERSGGLG